MFACQLFVIEDRFHIAIVYMVIFLTRGYIAVRQKNYLKHMDSMLGAFIFIGIAATVRLVYFLFHVEYGYVPVSAAVLLFVSVMIIFFKLLLFYALAGRLKQNILLIAGQILTVVIIYTILPWHFLPLHKWLTFKFNMNKQLLIRLGLKLICNNLSKTLRLSVSTLVIPVL